MAIQSPAELISLAERIVLRGLKPDELKDVAVLKPGKTFKDLLKACGTKAKDERVGLSHEVVVANYAVRLFQADIIEKSLLPNYDP